MSPRLQLSFFPQGVERQLSIREDDVKLVLERLPEETWSRFQVIHFHDTRDGTRWIGYVNHEKGEIAISPLPPGVRRIRFTLRSPRVFRSRRGRSKGRSRRDMLFDVFLDDIGRLQVIDEKPGRRGRLRPYERPEPPHTDYWRLRLWSFNLDGRVGTTGGGPAIEEVAGVVDVTEEPK